MRTIRRMLAMVVVLARLAAADPIMAAEEKYPTRTVRLIVPFPPGNVTDAIGRVIAERLAKAWSSPVIVENRAGASGNLGVGQVAKAAPDGYTVLFAGSTSHAANVYMYKSLPYDPVKDFTPVTLVFKGYMVLVVNAASPLESVGDVVAAARKAPGKLTFGSGTSSGRLSAEMMRQMAGLDMLNVPYKGNPPALTDLLGGQIDFMFTDGTTAVAQVRGGKIRALGVTSPARIAPLIDVPTMAEAGFKDYEISIWIGLYLPANAPAAITARLNEMVRKVAQSPEVKAWGVANVVDIVPSSPDELARFQAIETEKTARVSRAAGIERE